MESLGIVDCRGDVLEEKHSKVTGGSMGSSILEHSRRWEVVCIENF